MAMRLISAVLAASLAGCATAPEGPAFRALTEAPSMLVMDNQAGVVVTRDGTIYTPGIVGMDPASRKFVAADAGAQMAQIMMNLKAALNAAGADLDDIVQITIALASLEDYRAANPEYLKAMGGHRPARTIEGFTPWDPRFRVQVTAVAKIDPPAALR